MPRFPIAVQLLLGAAACVIAIAAGVALAPHLGHVLVFGAAAGAVFFILSRATPPVVKFARRRPYLAGGIVLLSIVAPSALAWARWSAEQRRRAEWRARQDSIEGVESDRRRDLGLPIYVQHRIGGVGLIASHVADLRRRNAGAAEIGAYLERAAEITRFDSSELRLSTGALWSKKRSEGLSMIESIEYLLSHTGYCVDRDSLPVDLFDYSPYAGYVDERSGGARRACQERQPWMDGLPQHP